jgi:hypothetical protein
MAACDSVDPQAVRGTEGMAGEDASGLSEQARAA